MGEKERPRVGDKAPFRPREAFSAIAHYVTRAKVLEEDRLIVVITNTEKKPLCSRYQLVSNIIQQIIPMEHIAWVLMRVTLYYYFLSLLNWIEKTNSETFLTESASLRY